MTRVPTRPASLFVLLAAGLAFGAAGRCAASPYYSITFLDQPGGTLNAESLNNLGQVVGTWNQNPTGSGTGENSPYFYNPLAGGQVTLLGVTSPSGQNPGGYSFQGNFSNINNLGQAAGLTYNTPENTTLLYNSATGQTTTVPINYGFVTDSGQVYGSIPSGGGNSHPAVYQNGTVQDLGLPPGAISAQASAANSVGQVLVQATMANGSQLEYFELSGGKWSALGTMLGAAHQQPRNRYRLECVVGERASVRPGRPDSAGGPTDQPPCFARRQPEHARRNQ